MSLLRRSPILGLHKRIKINSLSKIIISTIILLILSEVIVLSSIWQKNYLPSKINEDELISIECTVSKGQYVSIIIGTEYSLDITILVDNKQTKSNSNLLEKHYHTKYFNEIIHIDTYSTILILLNNSYNDTTSEMELFGEIIINGFDLDVQSLIVLLGVLALLIIILDNIRNTRLVFISNYLKFRFSNSFISNSFFKCYNKSISYFLLLHYEIKRFPLIFIYGLNFLLFISFNPSIRYTIAHFSRYEITQILLLIWIQPFSNFINWIYLIIFVFLGCFSIWRDKEDTKEIYNDLCYPFSRFLYIGINFIVFSLYCLGIIALGSLGITYYLLVKRSTIVPFFLPIFSFIFLLLLFLIDIYILTSILSLFHKNLQLMLGFSIIGSIIFLFDSITTLLQLRVIFLPSNIISLFNLLSSPITIFSTEFFLILLTQGLIIATLLYGSFMVINRYQVK